MIIKEDYQAFIYFLASILFGLGFLLVLINGYFDYQYAHFISAGRKDLLARLGFLTYATAALFYPLSFVPIGFLTWISRRKQSIKTCMIWPYAIMGLVLVGACFYARLLDQIIFNHTYKVNWIVGILLILFSISLFWNKIILAKM